MGGVSTGPAHQHSDQDRGRPRQGRTRRLRRNLEGRRRPQARHARLVQPHEAALRAVLPNPSRPRGRVLPSQPPRGATARGSWDRLTSPGFSKSIEVRLSMRAIVYSHTGGPDVLRLVERSVPATAAGQVRVRVHISGGNPTDWKSRRGSAPGEATPFAQVVPNQDGAGIVDALGDGVAGLAIGQRVWIREAAWQRADGTAQEYVVLPAANVAALPPGASFDLGASLGIPALTAHRCLTMSEFGPARLSPGSLTRRAVLVAGGAGAVGHAAIQLARWAGAEVITTVSGPVKAELARRAGAEHVINYRAQESAAEIRKVAPHGVDIVVEVAPSENAALNSAIVASGATIAIYANNGGDEFTLPIRSHMTTNTRVQFVLIYRVDPEAKAHAVAAVSAAAADGALPVGEDAGLPLHRFPLERTADAHAAVEAGAVGKVLIDVI